MIRIGYKTIAMALLGCSCAPPPEPLPPSDMPAPSASAAASSAASELAALPGEEQARRFSLARTVTAASGGRSPAALEVLALSSSSSFGRDKHSHLYAVVLTGQVEVSSDKAAESLTLERWHALWAPGVGVTLKGRDARVLLAFVSSEEGGGFDAGPERSWQERPQPGKLAVRNLAATRPLSWAGGKMHARLGFEQGPASLSLLYGDAKIGVPPHRHPEQWEVIGLLTTSGVFRHGKDAEGGVENGARVIVESGTAVAVQPPLEHAFEPDGQTDLFAVQLYLPPGPEQRFKRLAAKAKQ